MLEESWGMFFGFGIGEMIVDIDEVWLGERKVFDFRL